MTLLLSCSIVLLNSCGKKEKELTPKQIRAKADSIIAIKIKPMEQQAREDLDKRMSIEVKPKVDSIRKIPADTAPYVPVLEEEVPDNNDTVIKK